MADKSQQTEKATPRRVTKAREDGRFASAKELLGAVQFLAFVMMLAWWGGGWIFDTKLNMRIMLERAFQPGLTAGKLIYIARAAI